MFNRAELKLINQRIDDLIYKVSVQDKERDVLKNRLNSCEQFIPCSYAVEEVTDAARQNQIGKIIGWTVVKSSPIFGKTASQLFPTKGCAQKALDEHFAVLQFPARQFN